MSTGELSHTLRQLSVAAASMILLRLMKQKCASHSPLCTSWFEACEFGFHLCILNSGSKEG